MKLMFMRHFRNFSVAAVLGLFLATPGEAGTFLEAGGTTGLLVLNKTTSAITFCPGTQNGNTGAATGQCAQIGTFTSLSPEAGLKVFVATQYNAGFVINLATGVVFECAMLSNSSGVPTGKCKADAAH